MGQTLNHPSGATSFPEGTLTNKLCSNCGTPAPVEGSVFCNRCGARLPAEDILTCRKCGKTITDRQSRFCDRCGSPLVPAAQATSPVFLTAAPAAVKGTKCPACGFENVGENRFYCKQCGTYLPINKTAMQHGPAGEAKRPMPPVGGIRIKPDGMDELRQRPVSRAAEQPVAPPRTVPQSVVNEPAAQPKLPRKRRQGDSPKRAAGFSRRVAYGAAAVLVLALVIALVAVISPGLLNPGAANATAPNLFESLSRGIIPNQTPVIAGITPGGTKTAPGVTTAKPFTTTIKPVTTTIKPVTTPPATVHNQATTVITDTPLTVNGT